MNLLQIGFVSLILLALADGFILTSRGGFLGLSSIFGVLLFLIHIAALGKRTYTTSGTDSGKDSVTICPANYTHTPNDPTSCIRFISYPTTYFFDAYTACRNDGGQLLKLSTASFPIIQQLARSNSGACDYWVQTAEDADGFWFDENFDPTPNTPGLFFLNPTNGINEECGLMGNDINFYLRAANCSELHCYICQKYI